MKSLLAAAKNSLAGIINQIVSLFIQLVLRIVLLKYIGIELLGINATLSSVLSTLSLAELGFQSAIVFHLYEPLMAENKEKINSILNILRVVYNGVGSVFILLSVICIPILPGILKGITIDKDIILIFTLMVMNISVSYFFMSYKRALFFADQKEYISKIIDTLFNVIFFLIKLFIIIVWKNYLLFLGIQIMQTIVSNYVIHRICRRKYSFLHRTKINRELLNEIRVSVKNVFGGKLAGYIYGATDNVVVSAMKGTVLVGYLTNYTTISMAIKGATAAIFNAMTPIIGNRLLGKAKEQEQDFLNYTHLRYFIASLIVVPWVLFSDTLVEIIFGRQYVMSPGVSILLAVDLYIHIVYSSCCEYINGAGLFEKDRTIAFIGACLNIISSVILCNYIGITGVLVGTVISQVLFWILRSYAVYKDIFFETEKALKYGLKILTWTGLTVVTIIILSIIKNNFIINNKIIFVLVGGAISELFYIVLYSIFFSSTCENIQLRRLIIKLMKNRGLK